VTEVIRWDKLGRPCFLPVSKGAIVVFAHFWVPRHLILILLAVHGEQHRPRAGCAVLARAVCLFRPLAWAASWRRGKLAQVLTLAENTRSACGRVVYSDPHSFAARWHCRC
jgi:hypothetical protein